MSSIEDLLDRYLAGECSTDERAAVERYLAEHPEAAEAIAVYVDRLDGESERPAPPDTSESWRALRARMSRASVARARSRSVRWLFPMTAIAAAVMLAVIVRGREAPAHEYSTARGERSTVRLADGTTVHLAPDSRLRVGSGQREVSLEGEAYFEVVHNAAHPFTVVTGTDTVRDIGTAYAVRAYPGDHEIRVTVREGRISLTGAGLLGAGDVARVAGGRARVQHGINVGDALGRIEGRLAYHDTPLRDVLSDAGRWYVVDASVRDTALMAIPFTGTLSGLSAHDALALVAATTGLTATWHGTQVTLSRSHAR